MTDQTGGSHNKTRLWWGVPELQLVVIGFGLSVLWEFFQSPFYTDTFAATWGAIVFNRLHCAGGDALILLTAFWLVSLRWGRGWMDAGGWAPVGAFLVIGVAYTTYSEYFNVHLVARWAYSQWMPTVAGIGLVPLLQWIVVPILSVLYVRRRHRQQGWEGCAQIVY
jgi:hypothetical protein